MLLEQPSMPLMKANSYKEINTDNMNIIIKGTIFIITKSRYIYNVLVPNNY